MILRLNCELPAKAVQPLAKIAVYDGCGRCPEGLGLLACNDDIFSATFGSNIDLRVEAGRQYLIRIGGDPAAAPFASSGSGVLAISSHPDCPADFNRSGEPTVQDIFDFLAAYFTGCP